MVCRWFVAAPWPRLKRCARPFPLSRRSLRTEPQSVPTTNVSENDIARLAAMSRHTLTLADLIKYDRTGNFIGVLNANPADMDDLHSMIMLSLIRRISHSPSFQSDWRIAYKRCEICPTLSSRMPTSLRFTKTTCTRYQPCFRMQRSTSRR